MRKKFDVRNNSGITLIALIVTIIVLLILATFATYSGIEAIENTAYTKFVAELKIMQTHVNEWYEDSKDGKNVFDNIGIKNVSGLGEEQEQAKTALIAAGIEDTSENLNKYYFIDDNAKNTLGIEGVSQTVLVSVADRHVVSYLGLNYKENMYYTLEQLDEFYNVDYNNKNSSDEVDFEAKSEFIKYGRAKITVYNVEYEGYNEKWQVKYQKEGDSNWKTSDSLDFFVNESGTYTIQLINRNGDIVGTKLVTVSASTVMPIYAMLYTGGDNSDLELVFSSKETVDTSTRTRKTLYAGPWEISKILFESADLNPWFNYAVQIKVVTFEDKIQPQYTQRWFLNCTNLENINNLKENLDTRYVTTANRMFMNCSKLTQLDVTGFDTGNITDMKGMFHNCSRLTELDVSGFDTRNVTDMSYLFNVSDDDPAGIKISPLQNLDLTNWKTSKVTDMSYMFHNCSELTELDVSGFDTKNVTSMRSMFHRCSGLTELDVSGFDTRNVKDMSFMFHKCSGLTELDVSRFDTKNVNNMKNMFNNCSGLTALDISGFDTSKVTDMSWFFESISNITAEITIKGNVTTYEGMFRECAYEGGRVVLNYTSTTESIVDAMLQTNTSNGNIVKGRRVQ